MKSCAALAFIAATALAYDEYCPWWPEAERTGVRVTGIDALETLLKGKIIRQAGFVVSHKDCNVDVKYGEWLVVVNDACAIRYLYFFDFDGNGRKDLTVRSYTGAVGARPNAYLVTIMIDEEGKPHVSKHASFIGEGLLVTDFDKNGRFELMHSLYNGSRRDNHHYWQFVLYEARDAEWRRVIGKLGDIESPQFTSFTHRPNRKPIEFTDADRPYVPNDSSAPTRTALIRANIRWKYGQYGPHPIEFTDGSSCAIGEYAETVLIRGKRIEWAERPTEWLIKQGPIDIVTSDYEGKCEIERVDIRFAAKR